MLVAAERHYKQTNSLVRDVYLSGDQNEHYFIVIVEVPKKQYSESNPPVLPPDEIFHGFRITYGAVLNFEYQTSATGKRLYFIVLIMISRLYTLY